jgi:Protein of unknown function (DUF3455)
MTHRSLFASGLFVLALALPAAASAQRNGGIEVPVVPDKLLVEEGNEPFLMTRAFGTQNYYCLNNGTWKLYGPQATLYPGNVPFQIATHFLSPNPQEPLTPARATWMHSQDGSAVWAAKIQEVPVAGSIAWLLLKKVGTFDGTIGGGLLAQTTFIQRINTLGGLAPEGACTPNDMKLVPYQTDYIFYRAEKK